MTKKHVVLIIAGILLLLHEIPSFGEEITIFGNDYKPPKYYLKEGKPMGILVDIMRYIDQETEHTFLIQLYPWKRAYRKATAGKGGIVGLSMTTERLETFDYSDVLFYDDLVLVVLKGQEFPFETIEDLAGKRVGVRRGTSYGNDYERGQKEIFTVDEDGSAIQRLKKLRARRIDVALIGLGKTGLNHILRDDPKLLQHKNEFVVLEKPFKRDPNYLGFAKTMNMKEFLQEVNQVLHKGHGDGTIQKIINKYAE